MRADLYRMHVAKVALALSAALALVPVWVRAQANFQSPVDFQVSRPCQAATSIKTPTDAQDLEVGKSYPAYAVNKPSGASHVLLGTAGQRKWASLECGVYVGAGPVIVGPTPPATDPAPGECLPFFDDQHNPIDSCKKGCPADITPPVFVVTAFGQAVNQVCGAPGKVTGPDEFKQLMTAHPQVLADLMAYTGNRVFGNRPPVTDPDAYLEALTDAWYALHGFDHIFCGEPTAPREIGGLHFRGRYLQLQGSGEACRLPNYSQNEVKEGSIYTMGVRMKRANGEWAEFATKGYGYTLSAADMLKVVTRAFAENPTTSSASTPCILKVDDHGVQYDTVFVRRASGIRTFYPDATPDDSTACANPLSLDQPDVGEHPATGGETSTGGTGGGSAPVAPQAMTVGGYTIRVIAVDDLGVTLHLGKAGQP